MQSEARGAPMALATKETRDELQRKAIRLYNELARIRKEAQRVARYERPPLESRAAEIAQELRAIVDLHGQAIA
jgi:hypothetical protein